MMGSTRYGQQPPLQIYQDPVNSFDSAPMPSMKNPNAKKPSPLRPIKNAGSRSNIIFNPPQSGPSRHSPLKSAQQNSSSPLRAPFGNKLNMISMPPPGGPNYNTDCMEKRQPFQSTFKTAPQKALFNTFMNAKPMDKENYPVPVYPQSQNAHYDDFSTNFSLEGFYGQKPPLKRALMEAAPIHESRPLKKVKTDEENEGIEQRELPNPESFPPLHDDGAKPPHSYAQLIGMSILRAPNRRLTLAQIYKWISETYSFYNAAEAGWQNSIRHNLSLNKAFIKQERPKDDPGKGNYWAIEPGMEFQFIKEKSSRKAAGINENVLSTSLTPLDPPEISMFKPLTPTVQHNALPRSTITPPEPQLPAIPELSSDATIPASDAFGQEAEEVEDEAEEAPPSSPLLRSSPPTAMMNSSPPMARQVSRRNDTPPPVPRFPASSQNRSHKRKFASMDDSGYFSSLDSSVIRPQQVGRLLNSEADRPRIKRGRAEEEIARLRGSSYDSPTKSRAMSGFAPVSSSPLRRAQTNSQMLPPLTPAVKLKAPVRPPPSVSPNTNLRLHRDRVRELVGSPIRGMTCLEDNPLPWSPTFEITEADYANAFQFAALNDDYDVFAEAEKKYNISPVNYGSPEKRSSKRPHLDRSRSANVLTDISSGGLNKSIKSTPKLNFTPMLAPQTYQSPTKGIEFMESPLCKLHSPIKMGTPIFLSPFDIPQEDFYGAEFLQEEMNDFPGLDITQGFQRIGSGTQSSRSTPKPQPHSRPSMGRSFTSRF